MEDESGPLSAKSPSKSLTRKKQYSAEFKLQVIANAKITNNSQAAKLHEVDVRCVRRWKTQEKKLKLQVCNGAKGETERVVEDRSKKNRFELSHS